MADAVLEQRLVVGAGALALLFLVVAGVLVLLGGCALIACAVDRYRRADAVVDEILAETAEPVPPPASPDNVEPVRLDWHDECALILAATNDQTDGFDRLMAAIDDDHIKGD